MIAVRFNGKYSDYIDTFKGYIELEDDFKRFSIIIFLKVYEQESGCITNDRY